MIDRTVLSRRRLLAGLGGAAAGLAIGAPALARSAAAAPPGAGQATGNGWPAVKSGQVRNHRIEGSDTAVALLPGATATVLLHVARRFHYDVDELAAGEAAGHHSSAADGTAAGVNFRSGTALALRPDSYPAGAGGNLYPQQIAMVRDILAECDGVVRWGGDDVSRPMEGAFYIDVPPGDARLKRLAARLAGWAKEPGQGAGVVVDPAAPDRLRAAVALRRTQTARR
ncbi:hypothetical protein EV385_0413 [Krasilnikovia cinnamomea]|uniref:Secreted protein n=1 Tax=Krasilnikovia cinnamomea TaxID=349313 RepID=A0A4Q7ZF30_9ACTN|nr:hypothetical protein [Krasilnikovia cinnamomea]RZU48695.1 hypothetical protein EV385_0413 [Krasilnikovia cinnamomea]